MRTSLDIFFRDDLRDRIAALEAAAQLCRGEFREGMLFCLSLVRLSLGLAEQSTLIIPYRKETERPDQDQNILSLESSIPRSR